MPNKAFANLNRISILISKEFIQHFNSDQEGVLANSDGQFAPPQLLSTPFTPPFIILIFHECFLTLLHFDHCVYLKAINKGCKHTKQFLPLAETNIHLYFIQNCLGICWDQLGSDKGQCSKEFQGVSVPLTYKWMQWYIKIRRKSTWIGRCNLTVKYTSNPKWGRRGLPGHPFELGMYLNPQ